MSHSFEKVERSAKLSEAANDAMANWLSWVTPSEKLISELPVQLKNQTIKQVLFTTDTCEYMDAVLDFDVHSDDVFVGSIPKSGSSWMTTIAWLLTHNLNYEAVKTVDRYSFVGNFDVIFNPIAAQERAQQLLANDNTKSLSETEALNIAYNEIFNRLESPRVIKSHYPPYFLPKGIWTKGARVIYVARNPKDTAVSYYHFIRNYYLTDITIDDAVNMVIDDLSAMSPHLDHIQNFWKIKYLPNVFFVHYEDLVIDSFATIKNISQFLGCNYSDEQLTKLTEFISFKNMKHNKAMNRDDEVVKMEQIQGKTRPDPDFTFVRKGKPGGYKDDLNEEQIKKLDNWAKEVEKDTNFRFKM